jgi:putative pyruvate formate lyase activating enzyme
MNPPLNRKVTSEEYSQLVDYAERLGVTNAFVQEGEAASESFIPPFVSGADVDKIML